MICFCLLRKFLGGRHDQFIRIIRMLRLQRFRLDGCAAFRRTGRRRERPYGCDGLARERVKSCKRYMKGQPIERENDRTKIPVSIMDTGIPFAATRQNAFLHRTNRSARGPS